MIEINEETNAIRITRGNSLIADIGMTYKVSGEPYVPQEGDRIFFSVKHARYNAEKTNLTDKDPIIQKEIPINTLELRLEPEDTEDLNFADYIYDIKLVTANGYVDTFIADARLTICTEVD